jgi:hypothetical protein
MNRSRGPWLAVFAVLALAGCGRNEAGTYLAPTGIRPAPASWPGAVTGKVVYDPVNTPDLSVAPFPPTRVELRSGATVLAVDSLHGSSNEFLFTGLKPGTYTVAATSRAFKAGSRGNIPVREELIDAGDVKLTFDPLTLSNGMEIIGTMPGYRIQDLSEFTFPIDVTGLSLIENVWRFPNDEINPDGVSITAGTYRFKFATEFPAVVTNMTGWGDGGGVALTAPVVQHPAVLASGSATDIVMTFPTTGIYEFTLDERRMTFSVQFLHATPARSTRLARR